MIIMHRQTKQIKTHSANRMTRYMRKSYPHHLTRSIQRFALLCAMSIMSPQLAAQLCSKDNTPETVSPSNYTINNGELTDSRLNNKNLTWRRCFYGQQWDNSTSSCIGTPKKLNWQGALLAAAQSNIWRLPNTKELLSIVDLQCFAPPLHPVLFPDAPASLNSGVWTSTPLQTNLSGAETSSAAWIIDLGHGILRHQSTTQLNFVLFVKNL